jgi:hypothetical protein
MCGEKGECGKFYPPLVMMGFGKMDNIKFHWTVEIFGCKK